MRVNDFPQEPLDTLLVEGREVGDFDDWPVSWKKDQQTDGLAGREKPKAAAVE